MRSIVTLGAVAALAVAACSQAGEARTATPPASAEASEATARAAAWIAAPVHPAAAPVDGCTSSEDAAVCASDRARFQQKDWPGAWKGDIAAARNVAYCLTSSCDGAVVLNPVQGCAWREVIMGSGDAGVTERDGDYRDNECRQLGVAERSAAKRLAADIYREAFGRPLPQR